MAIFVIVIGLVLALLGIRQLIYFLSEFNALLVRFEKILASERFVEIEHLNNEMDELNYSYYEILDDINERLIVLENEKPKVQTTKTVQMSSQRKAIIALIESGLDDQAIAKQLGVGVGTVTIVRKLDVGADK